MIEEFSYWLSVCNNVCVVLQFCLHNLVFLLEFLLQLSATLTCGKPWGKHMWDKSWQAENRHGSATHSGDQITALPDKLFVGTHREVDGEGDRTAAGGETQITCREVFLASAGT